MPANTKLSASLVQTSDAAYPVVFTRNGHRVVLTLEINHCPKLKRRLERWVKLDQTTAWCTQQTRHLPWWSQKMGHLLS